ncbi:TetR/AcrR family transcriptional regulator [Nocardia anaemiae]|uniref:TetR/AcrR family transcriptional regulator n=1 Tax=Nocardia anaemiae TaxID=263910 RepID=UPI0007A3884E|nr:TetR/AcrR family transcriptional regulator [Nocardia anaemiae]
METPDASAVPKAFALMWGLDEGGSRGPKRGLSLDQVIDAAIEVADLEGVGALSMSRVAKRLGFTTMSLYRYVDSKDTLIELVTDRVVGPPPELPDDPNWRVRVEAWAWAEVRMIQQHPWWVDLPLAPPMGPRNMAWLDAGLSAFAGTAVPEPVKLQLVLNVSLYLIGRMRMAREMAASAEYDGYLAALGHVIDPQHYPALASALAHQAFDLDETNWAEADLQFGLDRLLDGYEQFVRSFEQ